MCLASTCQFQKFLKNYTTDDAWGREKSSGYDIITFSEFKCRKVSASMIIKIQFALKCVVQVTLNIQETID